MSVTDQGTGTTIMAGDSIEAGDGIDTLSISVSGTSTGAQTIQAFQATDLEKIMVSNFDAAAPAINHTVDLTLVTGETTVGLSSSSANGDTIFTGTTGIVDAEMSNGSADLTVTYGADVISGSADSQNLAVANVSAGTFTTNGIETLTVTTSLADSEMTNVVSAALETLTITGDKALTITGAIDFAGTASGTDTTGTINASAITDDVSLKVGADDENLSVTLGAGDDSINFQAELDTDDTVDGGAGTDTIKVDDVGATDFTNVSNFEVVSINEAAAAVAVDASKLSSGIETIILDVNDAAHDTGSKLASTVTNLTTQSVTLKHTTEDADDVNDSDGVKYTLTNATDTADDSLSIKLDAVGTDNSTGAAGDVNFGIDELDASNHETLNIESAANSAGTITANEIDTLTAASATTINVTGNASLEIGTITAASLTSFDASTNTKGVTATFSAGNVDAKMAAANSTFTFGSSLNASDTVTGGAGDEDSMTATVTGLTATTGALNISNVETVTLTTSGNNTLDLTNVTGVSTLDLTDNVQTITGLDIANTALELTGAAASSEIDVTAADATGSDDTLSIALEGATDSIIDADDIENLALTVNDDNSHTLDLTTFTGNSVSIGVKSGVAVTDSKIFTLGTLDNLTTSVTSTYNAKVTVNMSTADTSATFVGLGANIQNVTGSANADTFTIGETDAITHVVAGGAGEDTINLTAGSGLVNVGSISAVQTFNMAVTAGDDVTLTTSFHADVDDVTLTGGNSLSTFKTGTLVDGIETFNASGFAGNVITTVDDDKLDSTVEITGGALTTDQVSNTIATAATTYELKSTGVETLSLDVDADATVSVANATGLTTVDVDVATTKTAKIDDITNQTIVVTNAATGAGTVEAILADATGSTDSVNFKLSGDMIATIGAVDNSKTIDFTLDGTAYTTAATDGSATVTEAAVLVAAKINTIDGYSATSAAGAVTISSLTNDKTITFDADDGVTAMTSMVTTAAIADTTILATDDIETVNIEVDTAETISLADLEMTTASEVLSVNLTGDSALTISALDADVTTLNASGMATGGALTMTGRSATDTMIITGSVGNDTIMMLNKDDAIDAGTDAGTGAANGDTLDLDYTSVIGGVAIDLSNTTDQIATFNGGANAAVQVGFQHVDASGYTGNGAEITAHADGSTITGTHSVDSITLGAGVDVINFITTNGSDSINGFTINSDTLDFGGIAGITSGNSADATADATQVANAADATVYVFADGSDGTGAEAIADYSNTTDVASFLEAGLASASAEAYVALINDLTGDDVYAYLVDVDGDNNTTDQIDAGDITLIGTINNIGSTALDSGEIV